MKLLVVILLMGVNVVVGKKCQLTDPHEGFLHKFFRITKDWFLSLLDEWTSYMTMSKLPECKNCDLIRPPGQKSVKTIEDKEAGCNCKLKGGSNKVECACCFKVEKWNSLICSAAGFKIGKPGVFFVVTIDNYVLFSINLSLKSWWMTLLTKMFRCIPLPFPASFMSICFEPSLKSPSEETDNSWLVCFQISFGLIQVPVINLKPNCFNISAETGGGVFSPKTMVIQGEATKPAETQVVSEKYNPMVCLSNTRKKNSKLKVSRRRRTERMRMVDEKINWKESIQGDTPFLAVLHEESFPKGVKSVHLSDASEFELIGTMLRRADNERWLEDGSLDSVILPNKTCGGALVTTDLVLTICACIRTFYYIHVLGEMPPGDIKESPYDIPSAEIFVEFSGAKFSAIEDYHLVKDEKKINTKSTCAKNIVSGDELMMESSLVVMRFAPGMASDPKFPPPMKFDPKEDVVLVSFGMHPISEDSPVFKGKGGQPIAFDETSTDVFLKPCGMTDYVNGQFHNGTHIDTKNVFGLCSAEKRFQLCGGKVGFPLTTGTPRRLVGLAALPVECSGVGSTVGIVFDEKIVKTISSEISSMQLPPDATVTEADITTTAITETTSLNNPRTSSSACLLPSLISIIMITLFLS